MLLAIELQLEASRVFSVEMLVAEQLGGCKLGCGVQTYNGSSQR
jgi:hypothetical protein